MHVAVRCGGYRSVEVVRAIAAMEYQAVRRFQASMKTGKEESAIVEQMNRRMQARNRG